MQRVMPTYEIFKLENRNGFFMKVANIFRQHEIIYLILKNEVSGDEYQSKPGPNALVKLDDFSLNTYTKIQSNKGKKCVNCIKTMVSKNKRRYIDCKFNLDLAYSCFYSRYISKRIIAMGFPAFEKLEPFYRNSLPAVIQFFKEKHKNKVKVLRAHVRSIISAANPIEFITLISLKACL